MDVGEGDIRRLNLLVVGGGQVGERRRVSDVKK
jgi:hypothetical protein